MKKRKNIIAVLSVFASVATTTAIMLHAKSCANVKENIEDYSNNGNLDFYIDLLTKDLIKLKNSNLNQDSIDSIQSNLVKAKKYRIFNSNNIKTDTEINKNNALANLIKQIENELKNKENKPQENIDNIELFIEKLEKKVNQISKNIEKTNNFDSLEILYENSISIKTVDIEQAKERISKNVDSSLSTKFENIIKSNTNNINNSLQKYKDKAKKQIDANSGLNTNDKDAYKKEIDNATTIATIKEILNRAQHTWSKEESKVRIGDFELISQPHKDKVQNDIDQSDDKVFIKKSVDNLSNLNLEKSILKAIVDNQSLLSEHDKQDYVNKIIDVTTLEGLNQLEGTIIEEINARRNLHKDLQSLPYLSNESINKYIARITTGEKDSVKTDFTNENNSLKTIIESINNMDSISLDQKRSILSSIYSSSGIEDAKVIFANAQALNLKLGQAIEQIVNFEYFSHDRQNSILTALSHTENVEDVELFTAEPKRQHQELKTLFDNYILKFDELVLDASLKPNFFDWVKYSFEKGSSLDIYGSWLNDKMTQINQAMRETTEFYTPQIRDQVLRKIKSAYRLSEIENALELVKLNLEDKPQAVQTFRQNGNNEEKVNQFIEKIRGAENIYQIAIAEEELNSNPNQNIINFNTVADIAIWLEFLNREFKLREIAEARSSISNFSEEKKQSTIEFFMAKNQEFKNIYESTLPYAQYYFDFENSLQRENIISSYYTENAQSVANKYVELGRKKQEFIEEVRNSAGIGEENKTYYINIFKADDNIHNLQEHYEMWSTFKSHKTHVKSKLENLDLSTEAKTLYLQKLANEKYRNNFEKIWLQARLAAEKEKTIAFLEGIEFKVDTSDINKFKHTIQNIALMSDLEKLNSAIRTWYTIEEKRSQALDIVSAFMNVSTKLKQKFDKYIESASQISDLDSYVLLLQDLEKRKVAAIEQIQLLDDLSELDKNNFKAKILDIDSVILLNKKVEDFELLNQGKLLALYKLEKSELDQQQKAKTKEKIRNAHDIYAVLAILNSI